MASVPERKPQLESWSAQPGPADMVAVPEAAHERCCERSLRCGAHDQNDNTVSLNVPAASGLRRQSAWERSTPRSAPKAWAAAADGPPPALMTSRRRASVAARGAGYRGNRADLKAPPAGSSIAKRLTSPVVTASAACMQPAKPRHDVTVRAVIEPPRAHGDERGAVRGGRCASSAWAAGAGSNHAAPGCRRRIDRRHRPPPHPRRADGMRVPPAARDHPSRNRNSQACSSQAWPVPM